MKSFKLDMGGNKENEVGKSSGELNKNNIGGVIGLLIIIGTVWYFWGGGLEKQTSQNMENVYKKVSADAVQQYEIAKRQGDRIQICVQAGLVSASFLQEKNEASYQQWKDIEKTDCATAGIPK